MPSLFSIFRLTPVRDNDQQFARHILWLLLIRVVLFSLLIGVTLLIHEMGHEVILPPLFFILVYMTVLFGFSIGSAAVLQARRKHLRRFGGIQLISDTLFAALLVYATGCSQSIFTPVFILPIIAGGLILYRIGGLAPAAAATILYGGILWLEVLGFLPGYYAATPYHTLDNPLSSANLFAVHGLTFFLVGLLSSMLAGRLRTTEDQLSQTTLEYDRLALLYKQIFENITTGIITTDQDNKITSFNRAAENITGYPLGTVIGRSLAAVFPEIVLRSQQGRNACNLKKSDGRLIRAGYSISDLQMPTEPSDGRQNGEPNCKVITLQDISKVEEMERQVRAAEKMAAIGELSASIAHDFRNPLAAISGSAQLLALEQDDGLDPASLKTISSIILRESNRMAQTITDFLQFARPAAIQAEWFNLSRMVAEVIASLERAYRNRVQVEISTILDAWGDRQQLQTVLGHLLENACAFSEGAMEAVYLKARECSHREDGIVQLEILDAGPGIGPEARERLFEPFFSTRENGTGLGLSIAHQIIEAHRGTISIQNRDPAGCLVRIRLPGPAPASTR